MSGRGSRSAITERLISTAVRLHQETSANWRITSESTKPEEILAHLIGSRDGSITYEELLTIVPEGVSDKDGYLRTAINRLNKKLASDGLRVRRRRPLVIFEVVDIAHDSDGNR